MRTVYANLTIYGTRQMSTVCNGVIEASCMCDNGRR